MTWIGAAYNRTMRTRFFPRRNVAARPAPYETLLLEEIILRDYLALDRTALANERTLMSYLRTALALVIAGASALQFVDRLAVQVLAVALILAGTALAGLGVSRYRAYRRRIESISLRSSLPRHPADHPGESLVSAAVQATEAATMDLRPPEPPPSAPV